MKHTPVKKVSRRPIPALKKEAWRHFGKWIRERDNYVCVTCGKDLKESKHSCHAGHYVPQSKGNRLRFDERNVNAQCHVCNVYLRGNLSQYALFLTRKYGQGILEEFEAIKNERRKYTADELQEIIRRYGGD